MSAQVGAKIRFSSPLNYAERGYNCGYNNVNWGYNVSPAVVAIAVSNMRRQGSPGTRAASSREERPAQRARRLHFCTALRAVSPVGISCIGMTL
ncbi:hypothetical protein GCM10010430_76500 [Kitasatospora cystarginea]|uniref:Uncharacterized protein n=1 Tax=Kitasatospora cystarginea TaxID=58350 RepID=A0ABP5RWT9_9ACTN